MSKTNKIILYSVLLLIGLLTFILEIFIFQKPDGLLGLIICISSIYITLGSIIKLCKLSDRLKNTILQSIDILFFLP